MHYSKFIAFVMVSKVRIMVPTRLAGLPCWDGNFCPWDTPVAFSWFPEQNRAQCHALSLLGCGLGPLCILLQALGDFLSFLFIESSPCLQHPLCLNCSLQCIAQCSAIGDCAFHSVVFWGLLCCWVWPVVPDSSVFCGDAPDHSLMELSPSLDKGNVHLSSTIKETRFQLPLGKLIVGDNGQILKMLVIL